jgi:hypothetical protein
MLVVCAMLSIIGAVSRGCKLLLLSVLLNDMFLGVTATVFNKGTVETVQAVHARPRL